MEALVFAVVVVLNRHHRQETFVPELHEFRPFVFES